VPVPDFSRVAVGSSLIRTVQGGPVTGPFPVDRGMGGGNGVAQLFQIAPRIDRCEAVAQPHIRDLSTSTSQPGADGSKPCSTSQRTPSRLRSDHHARIRSRSTSVP